MRRSIAGADQGPTAEQQEGGSFGFISSLRSGPYSPHDPTSVSFPFLRRMANDHMVAMGLHFIDSEVLGAPWFYEGDDARVQTAADNLVRPIYGDLVSLILRYLVTGYSAGARNYGFVKPDWTYYDGGEKKRVWDNGVIDFPIYKSVTPLRAESARPVYKNGAFNGISYDRRYGSAGAFIIDGNQTPTIDLLHSIWGVHDQMKVDGNPYGKARIAHCAPIFWMFRYMWDLLSRAFEDNADPGPIVRFPQDDMPTIDGSGQVTNNAAIALEMGTKRRSGSTIAMPSDTFRDSLDKLTNVKMWDFEYPESKTNFDAMMNFIGYLEASKLRSLWLPDQGLIEGQGSTSSRNVASEFGDQRQASQKSLMANIDQLIDEVMVKPIISMAFPNYTGSLKKVTIGMGDDDNDLLRQAMQLGGQQNFAQFGINMRRLAEAQGFPMLDPAEQKRLMDEAKAQANQSKPPAVAPTQGRRALVTQTGFDEMAYHQLGAELMLADVAFNATDDGDFVASLPSTDVFADLGVVKQARDLRSASQAFLAWAYRDFALYVSKQRFARADDDGELLSPSDDRVDLLQVDSVKRAAAKILRGWSPSPDRVGRYAEVLRKRLAKVHDLVGGAHSVRLGSERRARSIDEVAATWLEERAAESVKSIMTTTREQLADALADGLRAGRDYKEIASDIRARFEGFPKSRAEMIAFTEVGEAYSFATVQAGMAAGVKMAQLVDGESDAECKQRNGRIVPIGEAAKHGLLHPWCRFFVKLLPQAPASLSVRHEALADGVGARYDTESETILISTDTSGEDETKFMLLMGQAFAEPSAA